MASYTREIRTARVEDWNGNIYKFGSDGTDSGGSIGPDKINTDGGGVNTSDGSIVGDTTANNASAIVITSPTSGTKNVATVSFDNATFGKYNVKFRAKCSGINATNMETTVLIVNVYYVDNTGVNPTAIMTTIPIKKKHFNVSDIYTDICFMTNFSGIYTTSIEMKIEILINGGVNSTITFDSISIIKAFDRTKNEIEVTLLADAWGNTSPYSQKVMVEGIKDSDDMNVYPVLNKSLSLDVIKNRKKWTGLITEGETKDGYIMFYCVGKKPSGDFPVLLKGVL